MQRRRRRFFGRKRFGRPVARQRTFWHTALFAETLNVDATPTEFVVWDPSLVVSEASMDYNRNWRVQRVIINGAYGIVPTSPGGNAREFFSLYQALFVADREDTDVNISTSSIGDVLEGGVDRVLFSDVHCGVFQGLNLATPQEVSDAIVNADLWRTQIDVKRVTTRGHDGLIVFSQQMSDVLVADVSTAIVASFVTRVLVNVV